MRPLLGNLDWCRTLRRKSRISSQSCPTRLNRTSQSLTNCANLDSSTARTLLLLSWTRLKRSQLHEKLQRIRDLVTQVRAFTDAQSPACAILGALPLKGKA